MIEKYPVELDEHECDLIVKNALVSNQLKSTLVRISNKKGIHKIHMSLNEITDIVGWMAA